MMESNESGGLFVEAERSAESPPVRPVEPPARRRTDSPETPDDTALRSAPPAAILVALERIERVLGEIRSRLDGLAREQRHREFSPARLIGALLQALVVGLVLWALMDWAFSEPRDRLLIKLAFAGVFQLAALTAFILGREVD